MNSARAKKLRRNFSLLFWSKALLNLKIINIVVVLFFLHRGLTLAQVFLLSVVWAVVTIFSEVPSSYCADRWGRKKTLLVGMVAYATSSALLFVAHDFWVFALSAGLYAFSYALFSGTDEALVYDTTKELGESKESLKHLGHLSSADRVLKIVAPLVGALIAQDLIESQFLILLTIDAVAALLGGFAILFVTEPNHYMDVEEQEAGIIKDSWKVLTTNTQLTRLIFSKSFVFIAAFIVWRFHQEYFTQIGISIITLGIAWSGLNVISFLTKKYIHRIAAKRSLLWRVKALHYIILGSLAGILVAINIAPAPYVILAFFMVMAWGEVVRGPLFSELFNKAASSYNRATTLSLANFVKSILDIPLLFLGAWIVSIDITFPFYLAAAIVLFVILVIDRYHKTC